jgi:hypothetical protein
MLPLNRAVALLTPVFGAAASIGSAWLAKHFPGIPTPSAADLKNIEVAGFLSATSGAIMWLHGHQKWEARIQTVEQKVEQVVDVAETVDPGLVKALEQIVKAEIAKLKFTGQSPQGIEVATGAKAPVTPAYAEPTQAPPQS